MYSTLYGVPSRLLLHSNVSKQASCVAEGEMQFLVYVPSHSFLLLLQLTTFFRSQRPNEMRIPSAFSSSFASPASSGPLIYLSQTGIWWFGLLGRSSTWECTWFTRQHFHFKISSKKSHNFHFRKHSLFSRNHWEKRGRIKIGGERKRLGRYRWRAMDELLYSHWWKLYHLFTLLHYLGESLSLTTPFDEETNVALDFLN